MAQKATSQTQPNPILHDSACSLLFCSFYLGCSSPSHLNKGPLFLFFISSIPKSPLPLPKSSPCGYKPLCEISFLLSFPTLLECPVIKTPPFARPSSLPGSPALPLCSSVPPANSHLIKDHHGLIKPSEKSCCFETF